MDTQPGSTVRRPRSAGTSFCSVFPSQLGWMAARWREQRLIRLTFDHDTAAEAVASVGAEPRDGPEPTYAISLIGRLQRLAAGEQDDLLDIPLEESHLTDFQRRVIHYCRRIPRGTTQTYAGLATQAGSPGAARAVGNTMASNRFPLIVPCHRVVGSGGRLGGYSSPRGLATKRRLLALEGVRPFAAP